MKRAICANIIITFEDDSETSERTAAMQDALRNAIDKAYCVVNQNFSDVVIKDHHETLSGPDVQQLIDNQSCPFCGSHEIAGGDINAEHDEAWQTVGCNDCGEKWQEIYRRTTTDVTCGGDIPYPRPSTTKAD